MRDPFSEPASKQLYREAQIGLTILGCLVLLFCYLAIKRFSGELGQLPEAVRQAPLARVVQPDGSPQGYSEFRDPVVNTVAQANLDDQTSRVANNRVPVENAPNHRFAGSDSGTSVRLATAVQTVMPPQPDKAAEQAIIQFPDIDLPTVVQFPESQSNQQEPDLDAAGAEQAKVFAQSTDEAVEAKSANDTESASGLEPEDSNGFAIVPETPAPDLATSAETTANDQNTSLDTDQNTQQPNTFAPSSSGDKLGSAPPSTMPSAGNSFRLPEISQQPFLQDTAPLGQSEPRMSSPHPISTTKATTEPTSVIAPMAAPVQEQLAGVKPTEEQPQIQVKQSLPESDRYTTRAGDSFFTISQQCYDDGQFFKALYQFNLKQADVPFDLQPGIELVIPTCDILRKQFASLCPPAEEKNLASDSRQRLYLTKGGETLFGIARDQLGQASRFDELIQMNELRLPRNIGVNTPLHAGLKLVLPRLN
jgi:hypothetical protein